MKDIFALRIREERQKKCLSQRFMAAKTGVDENTYHNYEYGNCKPSLPKLVLLAEALEINLDYLCGRSNRKRNCPPVPHAPVQQLLGENLKRLRAEKGITQKKAALALGLSEHAYQYYEIRQRMPSYETLQRLADFYDISLDALTAEH